MSPLKLGTYNLPSAEVALVKTLFRLFSHGGSFRWTFVNAPPYDALLIDDSTPEGMNAEISRITKAVLRLTRMNTGSGPNTLERPIRAERLQSWLAVTEHSLRRSAQPAPEAFPPAAQTSFTPPRFKLRRWPAAVLLRGDATRIRMATLLSRRALTTGELSVISQQPFETCEIFLHVLRAAGLIQIEAMPALDTPAPVKATDAGETKPALMRGLIAGIRRRLGL